MKQIKNKIKNKMTQKAEWTCAIDSHSTLQTIHLQSLPFQDKIKLLNCLKLEHFLKSPGE